MNKFSRLPFSYALGVISLVVVALGTLANFTVSSYVKRYSVSQLATDEARRTSELIFQNVYAAMKRGAVGDELDTIIADMSGAIPDIKIRLLRSSKVAELFGDTRVSREAREHDPVVREAFATASQRLVEDGDKLRFVYPVLVKAECAVCHTNSRINSVNGVIDISFPVTELRVPLEYTILSVSYLFGAVVVILVLLTYFCVHYFLVRPIADLADHMHAVGEKHDLSRRLPPERNAFREVADLGDMFNKLLDKLEVTHRRLRERSERDRLTGLYNRHRFEELACEELGRSKRFGHQCGVLVVDLNDFKPVNDTWGHDAGDELLVNIAHALRLGLRGYDIVARMGGDEFMVLLPETGPEQAVLVIDRLKDMVTAVGIERDGRHITVGAAVGSAIYPVDGDTIEELIKMADVAMYENKQIAR